MNGEPAPPAETSSPGVRLRQLPAAFRRALRHPMWVAENIRMLSRRRAHARREFSLDPYDGLVRGDERAAVIELLGISQAEYERVAAEFWAPSVPAEGDLWDARESLQRVVNAVVRLLEPTHMVETGVSRGVASAVALAAMRDLGHGHLYSIDLPPLLVDEDRFIGSAVPSELHDRWTLLRGPSRVLLPKLLERLEAIDVSLHDADHTYPSQLEEFRAVWPYLSAGGVLVCDDVAGSSLIDFAAEHGLSPVLIRFSGRYRDDTPIGLLRKP